MPDPVEPVEATEQIHTNEQNGPGGQPPQKKRFRLTSKQKTLLAIGIICLMVIGAFYAPPEGDSNNVTGDPATIPTVAVTGLQEKVPLNRHFTYHGLELTLLDAQIAQKFSDDRKRIGNYTLRIDVFVKNSGSSIVGVDYVSAVQLIDQSGRAIKTKSISIKPTAVPGSTQTGFFDFPIDQTAPLSAYTLQLDANTLAPLK